MNTNITDIIAKTIGFFDVNVQRGGLHLVACVLIWLMIVLSFIGIADLWKRFWRWVK